MKNDPFESDINRQIRDLEVAPPDRIWDDLDSQLKTPKRSFMSPKVFSLLAAVSFMILAGLILYLQPETENALRQDTISIVLEDGKTVQHTDYVEEEIPVAQIIPGSVRDWLTDDRPLLLYFYNDDCPYCERLEEETLSQASVKQLLDEKFKMVSLDVRDPRNMEIVKRYKIPSSPTLLLIEKHGMPAYKIRGFMEAEDMEAQLKVMLSEYRRSNGQPALRTPSKPNAYQAGMEQASPHSEDVTALVDFWLLDERPLLIYFYSACENGTLMEESMKDPIIKDLTGRYFNTIRIFFEDEAYLELQKSLDATLAPSLFAVNSKRQITYSVLGHRDPGELNTILRAILNNEMIPESVGVTPPQIEITERPRAFKIYPNPSNGIFQVELDNAHSAAARIQILNMGGKLITDKKVEAITGTWNQSFNLSHLEKGYYVIRIERADEVLVEKILIQ